MNAQLSIYLFFVLHTRLGFLKLCLTRCLLLVTLLMGGAGGAFAAVPGTVGSDVSSPMAQGEPESSSVVVTPLQSPSVSPLDRFAPLLDGREVAGFRDLRIGALAASGEGPAIAMLNGRILHEGDMLGLAKVIFISPEALVLAFNNRNYVLHPRQETMQPSGFVPNQPVRASTKAAGKASVAEPKSKAKSGSTSGTTSEAKRRKRSGS